MGSLIDPLTQRSVLKPVSLTMKNPDVLTKEHRVSYTGDQSLGSLAARINRAIRDQRVARPGSGRWVEYILPDMRRVYVESRLQRAFLGVAPSKNVTARVHIKAGGMEFTNDLHALILMGMVVVSGDLLDVVRTARTVGLYVPDPEQRGKREGDPTIEKRASGSLVSKAMRSRA